MLYLWSHGTNIKGVPIGLEPSCYFILQVGAKTREPRCANISDTSLSHLTLLINHWMAWILWRHFQCLRRHWLIVTKTEWINLPNALWVRFSLRKNKYLCYACVQSVARGRWRQQKTFTHLVSYPNGHENSKQQQGKPRWFEGHKNSCQSTKKLLNFQPFFSTMVHLLFSFVYFVIKRNYFFRSLETQKHLSPHFKTNFFSLVLSHFILLYHQHGSTRSNTHQICTSVPLC